MKATSIVVPVFGSALLLSLACGSKTTPTPSGSTARLTGKVSSSGLTAGAPSDLEGATVTASIDRNKNGRFDADEQWTTTSGAKGAYALTVELSAKERMVVSFSHSGDATVYRSLDVAPGAAVPLNATLSELEDLSCTAGRCQAKDLGLVVKGLQPGVSGSARLFNPVTQADAFPGDFNDSAGNLLVSGVFATFEMEKGGQPVKTLSAPATLQLRMPRDTWSVITDVEPSTSDKIEVPMYAFDEVKGTWVRDGTGYLQDGTGATIPVATLPQIKAGTFTGEVVAVGQVTHFSTWNIDWPIATHGCVKVCIADGMGNAAPGATVSLTGITYTGSSTPVAAGADGCVCLEGMRSEGPGEDVDNDGVTNEVQRVGLRVAHDGKYYDLGIQDMPTANATCGGSGCLDLGTVRLTADKELRVGLCTFHGTVRDRRGGPVSGATVYAYDDGVPSEAIETACLVDGSYRCTIGGTTDSSGAYTATWPVLYGPSVVALRSTDTPPEHLTLWGQRTARGCPTTPLDVTLDQGYRSIDLTVSVAGGSISWTPATISSAAAWGYVMVGDTTGTIKWMVLTPDGVALNSPVTYGTTPQGATQSFPASGSPAALASGDKITVWLTGPGSDGVLTWATGQATVP